MRTNIDIDDTLMAEAMKAGPYQTKKEAVEAGLKLLARQAAYREILKWEGKLRWEGDESIDWTAPGGADSVPTSAASTSAGAPAPLSVQEAAGLPVPTAAAVPTAPKVKPRGRR
jgi:antitoxin ParD1/3/4